MLNSSTPPDSDDTRTRYPAGGAPRVGELERLGPDGREVLVLGADAPGFDDLPADRKTFAYYLYRAAIAGNDILYLQSHRHAFGIKQLLEAILSSPKGLPDGLRGPVHDYLKLVWIHHGHYNHYTHMKFVPAGLSREGLRKAVTAAAADGAKIPLKRGESIDLKLARLDRTIFDPDYEPVQTNQSDGPDIVATSAVNFWDPSVTQKDIESLPPEWRYRLNVRFARRGDEVVPEVYRIGGLFTRELRTVSHFLRLAHPLAEDEHQARSIQSLLEFYRTGDEESFRQHSVHWLKSDPAVDYLNGFVEQYLDPRGIIGSFEANVNFRAGTAVAARIAENALYFEQKMPWPDRFKRPVGGAPVARVVNVVVETGDAGPISPAAYNLPNYNDIRRDHGSKNVILLNIENTQSQSLLERTAAEFYLPEYRENVLELFVARVRPLQVYLHEIIGHGSGQPDPDLAIDPRTALGRVYSALEECRADLAALYHMSDPKLVEIGAVSADEHPRVIETAYLTQTQGWLMRYDHIVGMEVREAHNKGDQLILMYLVENGGKDDKDFGLDVIETGGKVFVRLRDASKVHEGVRELLTKLQVMKSTGDYAGAAALFDRFGTWVRPDWHRNIVARLEALKVPKIKAFVFPRLEPVLERRRIVDVQAFHDEDLTTQQLRFSRLQRVTRITAET